jgi:hypothetical protein
MKSRTPLAVAAAVVVGGLAPAQQVQVQFAQPVRAYPSEPTTSTTPTPEYKPAANASPNPASLTVPADLQKVAKEWVGKLGSPVYAEREKATRELAKMGRMALPALQEALGSSTEPEVALRAEGLLPKAEAEDMKARVGSFLMDVEGKYEHTLPGWDKFKAAAGNDRAARKLFAEMLKSPVTHQMLLAAEKTAEEANAVLNQYVTRLYNQQNGGFRGGWGGNDFGGGMAQPAKLPDLVAALFLESRFSDREVMVQPTVPWGWGGAGNVSVVNYIGNVQEVSNAVYSNSGDYAAPIRKIMIQWMDTRETAPQAYQAYNFANSIFNGDPKKTTKYACRVLEAEGSQSTSYNKLNILQNLANKNAQELREIVPSVAKCFDDTLLIWNFQSGSPGFDIQLRDYALAFALQATDQKPEDYGMTRNTNVGTGKQLNNQQAYYFTDDTPPKMPGGGVPGGIRRGGGRVIIEDDVKKPEEPKKEDPKDPKKEEPKKKVSQDDRRKIAFKKWEEWVKDSGLTKEPKKEEPKKDEPLKDKPKKEEPKKLVEQPTTTPPVIIK